MLEVRRNVLLFAAVPKGVATVPWLNVIMQQNIATLVWLTIRRSAILLHRLAFAWIFEAVHHISSTLTDVRLYRMFLQLWSTKSIVIDFICHGALKIIVVCFIRSFYSLIIVLTLDFNCLRLTMHVGVGRSGNNSNSHSLVSFKMHSAVTK